ncbi:spheroidene monooxygenase [Aggregicoccus sp. 17bor-14]|uniref:spheroidene monooxygenase n=1 Tax=Myxococcaceae TaxID=31 RepID=UPI00129CBF72|nr:MULTISPECIES: spheroidene monooxygenase [Myxococcaceae]MBF5041305.1 spheroidene monooxygenase [Simulacricoccus sp. 17bor-14]MRI87091.1 spheroidene monooxygenase [Aggregicoccus sp. 17bor-14]
MTLLAPTSPLAALTLLRYAPRGVPGALLRQGLESMQLARTPGLRFFRLLGTARGRGFGPWEPTRWAAFTVWDSAAALDAFEAHSRVAAGWRARAVEQWTLRMRPVRWHGAWGGVDPFAGFTPGAEDGQGAAAPLVVLTRATLRLRHLRAFRAAAAALEEVLARQEGLVASLAAGEVPLLKQATFSLWQSGAAVRGFAYAGQRHAGVVQRTRREGWYSEELFARLRPLSASGTWDGREPLSALLAPGLN